MNIIDRQILRLALPSIVSNITVPLLGLCDVAIMGHVGGATSIGAIAVGSMIFNTMYWLFVFLRMGSSGLTAQAYGAQLNGEVAITLWRGLLVGIVSGLAIVALQWPLQQLTFWMMRPTADVAQLCLPYYYICIWGAPAVLGQFALTGWLVGMQNTRVPMLIAIGQNIVNISLSLLLVVGLGWGVKGVATGTLVAQWLAFTATLLMAGHRYGALLRRHRPTLTQLRQGIGRFFRLNLDIFLRTVCLVSVNLYFTSAGAAQGALILAANTLLMQLFMIYSYMTDGFANAGEALAGRYLGAADRHMLSLTVRHLFAWGMGVALLFTLAYAVGGSTLLSLLTSDDGVVSTALTYLPWAILIPFAGMAAFVWDGIFIGTTRSRGMLAACFWAAVVFFTLWFALSPLWGNHALWLALIAYLVVRGLVQTIIWRQ